MMAFENSSSGRLFRSRCPAGCTSLRSVDIYTFGLPPANDEAVRNELDQLRTLVRTGQIVGFGHYWVPNPNDPQGNPHPSLEVTVHRIGEASTPEFCPLPFPKGVV